MNKVSFGGILRRINFYKYFTFRYKRLLGLMFLLVVLLLGLQLSGGIDLKFRKKSIENAGVGTSAPNTSLGSSSSPIVQNQNLGLFSISIDKLNVSAPVIRGVDPTNKAVYNKALEEGVAHMTGTALPGDGRGNVFIYGHSSSTTVSKYDKIFIGLNDLTDGDNIGLKFNDQDYRYVVTGKKIIEKTDMSVLDQTTEETLTLMTCWPIGTDNQRMVVTARKLP